ncbi:MAG TPA: DUF1592 domain-containing protein [Verrucomicrobiales bacterium]|nr:DUF1592 domain-containing protein [Verrucomicrobiales bacterium]
MPGTRHFPFIQAASVVRALWIAAAAAVPLHAAESAADFAKDIRPILEANCFECHADGAKKGSVAFDEHASDAALVADKALWFRVLKNVRNGLMPPPDKKQPAAEQKQALQQWIKRGALQLDPANPDPGRPVLRRLNRTEYRNTIRALTGVDFRVDEEFPADDTGDGFDNLGEVLSISPLLLEKYLAAAKTIVQRAVPPAAKAMPEEKIGGNRFHRMIPKDGGVEKGPEMNTVTFYEPRTLTAEVNVKNAGQYTLTFDLSGREKYVEGEVDLNRCRLKFKADGEQLGQNEYRHAGGRNFRYDFTREWKEGRHEITVEAEPLTPNEKQVRSLGMEVNFVILKGPADPQHWTKSENYDRWFPREVPADAEPRRAYAKELLGKFATRAFRRPADDGTVDRLTKLAQSIWSQPSQTFEMGIGRAMEAVLASPRFLFLEEFTEPAPGDGAYPFIDDYSLASRLSYFLWSTLPDEELLRLAGEKKLRSQLGAQFQRMLADSKTQEFFRNFTGQWLQGRDIEGIPIDARFVLIREQKPDPEQEQARRRFFELRRREASQLTDEEKAEMEKVRAVFRKNQDRFKGAEFSGDLRRDMRRETEMFFEYIIRENRPLTELINADYTFLNRRLAEHYGVPGVEGNDLRKVTLPPDSPRGGILTQGTVLAVTSNPTRTSPVKRGLFILDNILGSPPPPPPPNIPALDDFSRGRGFEGTLRQNLMRHRADAKCASCHNRMDPLGLAFENFNAMGKWRDQERGGPVDAGGKLVSGEEFKGARELKHILVANHKESFYRCFIEKLLIYSLGRGLSWNDETTVDLLLEKLTKDAGKSSSLLQSIIESPAFQRRRSKS